MTKSLFKPGDKVVFCGPIECSECFGAEELEKIKSFLNKVYTIVGIKRGQYHREYRNAYIVKEIVGFYPYGCELRLISNQLMLFESRPCTQVNLKLVIELEL